MHISGQEHNNESYYVSGPVSLSIVEFDGQMIYLFGDRHYRGSENSCPLSCDTLKNDFSSIKIGADPCWDVAALFHEWLTYNSDNGILTDFFYEIPKPDQSVVGGRSAIPSLIQVRNTDNIMNELLEGRGWSNVMDLMYGRCFRSDRRNCPYSEAIRFHFTDLRQYDVNNTFQASKITTDLFVLTNLVDVLIDEYLKSRRSNDNKIFLEEYFSLINIIEFLLDENEIYFSALLSSVSLSGVVDLLKIQSPKTRIERMYNIRVNNLLRMSVDDLYKSAYELKRLRSQSEYLADSIVDHISKYITRTLPNIRHQFREKVRMLDQVIQHPQKFSEDVVTQFKSVVGMFKALSIPGTDIYVLTQLMKFYDSKDVIVYMGGLHTQVYRNFFDKYLKVKITDLPQKSERCTVINENMIPTKIYRQHFEER